MMEVILYPIVMVVGGLIGAAIGLALVWLFQKTFSWYGKQ